MHITRDFEIKQAVPMYWTNGYSGETLWKDKTPEQELKELVKSITIPLQTEDIVRKDIIQKLKL